MHRLRGLAGLLALSTCAFACSGRTTSAAPTSTRPGPVGFTVFTHNADHLRLSVPSSWRAVDPSSPGAVQAAQDLATAHPGLQSLIGSGDLAAKGIRFLAVAVDGQSYVYVDIKAAAGSRDSDLPKLVDALKGQYQQLGATVESTMSVPLAGHQALQVRITLPSNDGSGGTTALRETQDIVTANDLAYIVTLIGSSPDLATIGSSLNVS